MNNAAIVDKFKASVYTLAIDNKERMEKKIKILFTKIFIVVCNIGNPWKPSYR
jgi:hypothetical protein